MFIIITVYSLWEPSMPDTPLSWLCVSSVAHYHPHFATARLFDCEDPGGSCVACFGWAAASGSYNLSYFVIPNVCFKFSRVRFVSAFCLFSKSFRMFLLRWISRCESCWRCFNCSFLSLWILLRSAARASCCWCLSFASFFCTTAYIYSYTELIALFNSTIPDSISVIWTIWIDDRFI